TGPRLALRGAYLVADEGCVRVGDASAVLVGRDTEPPGLAHRIPATAELVRHVHLAPAREPRRALARLHLVALVAVGGAGRGWAGGGGAEPLVGWDEHARRVHPVRG